MKREGDKTNTTRPKPSQARGLSALLGAAPVSEVLPEDVRAEIHRMSTNATEHVLKHMTYDEAREVMRYGWPSHYFGHLQRIARKAKL